MFAPVTKAATTVDAASELGAAVLRAGRTALAAPTGPVYLGVPTDLLGQPAGAPENDAGLPAPEAQPSDGELRDALAMMERAERPLLWVGGGALRARAGEAVGLLAERLNAPVITTYN